MWNEIVGAIEGPQLLLDVPTDYDDYCERYIATFDVGTPAPPVPLIESHYNKREPIPRILHENILFYRQFGLQLRDSSLENADHLRHQLEFIEHLLVYHSELAESGQTTASEQVAQALVDYVRRHLSSWVAEAVTCTEDAPLQLAGPALSLVGLLAHRILDAIVNDPEVDAVSSKEALLCSD